MMDSQKFETVAQSNFLRMYDAVKKREAVEQRIPSAAIAVRERLRCELDARRRETFGIASGERHKEIQDNRNEKPEHAQTGSSAVKAPEDMMAKLRERLK